MSAVETLREAAKVLRERAGMTHAAHTQQVGEVAKVTYLLEWDGTPVAERSVMHPGVALALADWLDAEVAVQDSMQPLAELVSVCVEQAGGPAGYVTIGHDDDGNPQMHADSSPAALRVAEAILGGAR